MRTFTLLLAFTAAAAMHGCLFYDQLPVKERSLYQNAEMRVRHYSFNPALAETDVVAGDAIVLELMDGYSHGRVSTAHGSHRAFFFELPGDLEFGQVIRCSADDGTLGFDAFAGAGSLCLDPDSPSEAIIEVQSVTPSSLRAKIMVSLYAYSPQGAEMSEPQLVTHEGVYTFNRRKVRTPHSSECCADLYIETVMRDEVPEAR